MMGMKISHVVKVKKLLPPLVIIRRAAAASCLLLCGVCVMFSKSDKESD